MKLPGERFDYSPMASRPVWKLPKGARIAVWTIVNVEEWDIEKAMARQYLTAPQGVSAVPDVPNWAWHDYGMRVGFRPPPSTLMLSCPTSPWRGPCSRRDGSSWPMA